MTDTVHAATHRDAVSRGKPWFIELAPTLYILTLFMLLCTEMQSPGESRGSSSSPPQHLMTKAWAQWRSRVPAMLTSTST